VKRWILIMGAVLLLGLGALGAGCGLSGGSDAISLDEYFQKIDEVQENNDATFATQEASAEEPSADATGEELAQFLRDSVTASAATLHDSGAAAGDIEPPDEVADAHADVVAAINDAADALDGIADSIPDSLTLAELEQGTFFDSEDLNAAFDSLATACNTLEEIATANNITVDLACDEV